jgi:hypothetical protein
MNQLLAEQRGEELTLITDRAAHEEPTVLDEREVTMRADPAILKQRLIELETYAIEHEETPAEELEAPPKSAEPARPRKHRPAVRLIGLFRIIRMIPWRRLARLLPAPRVLVRLLVVGLIVAIVGYAGFEGYKRLRHWWEQTAAPDLDRPSAEPQKRAPSAGDRESPRDRRQPSPTKKAEKMPDQPSAMLGTLEITSNPTGAVIFLNDRNTGRRTPATFENLDTKQVYQLGLYQNNYQYWEQKVAVAANETHKIQADLQINFGSLDISSLPTGSEVFIAGKRQGITPLKLSGLKPGEIVPIRIVHEGFEPWTGSAKIFAGKTAVVQAVLQKP